MFKLVVLSALVAIVAAKPSGLLGAHLSYAAVAAPAVAVPAAVSHQYRTDVVSKPVVATYAAAPIVEKAVVAAPIVEKAVVAAPIVEKAVVAAPVARISSAVTHQSRVDYHHPTVVAAPVAYAAHTAPVAYAAHAAPVAYAAHAAPIAYAAHAAPVAYAAHAVHAAPAVHAW